MSALQSAFEILKKAGKIEKDVVGVRLGQKVYDLHTPIAAQVPEDFVVVRTTEDDGLRIIRHSTAHILADAVQKLFPGTKVTIGPAVDDGFYYDFAKPGAAFTEEDLGKIEKAMLQVIKADSPFRRSVVTRDAALSQFRDMGESFKVEVIESIPEGEEISLYTHGKEGVTWFDVCEGPHVPKTSYIKAIKLTSVAGAYWRGDEKRPMLQRIYGTAFPSAEALEEHMKLIEEAKARDHRKLGKELGLFMFDESAPAMPFFLPPGAHVYNALVGYVRGLYDKHGYEEVITPQLFDPKVFRTSGHLPNYAENTYRTWTEDELTRAEFAERELHDGDPKTGAPFYKVMRDESMGVKPMNCPSHCIIFGSKLRSYRELPWRIADFGRLHRYERGGAVHGLSRVRSFCQDDAHIFCSQAQVAGEIDSFIRLLYEVYETFRFEKIDIKLATRPDNRVGTEEFWDLAEGSLELGLKAAGLPFDFLPGEGAFYGPKIEFHVQDALKRSWQLGTIQFDPNLPERFDLSFVGEDGKQHRPIMLHRAILGSLERFFSVYLEHCGGKFPTWLAPKQVMLLTVSEKAEDYAKAAQAHLRGLGIRVAVDLSADMLGAKIRRSHAGRFPYVCVIGLKEAETRSLGVRSRDRGELGSMPLDDFAAMILAETEKRS
jgi:threonyl-tRNA synthetase